ESAKVIAGGKGDDKVGWFIRPTVIETTDPDFKLLREELFGPILTVYPYADGKFDETLDLCDRTSPYGLTGAVFATDRQAIRNAVDSDTAAALADSFARFEADPQLAVAVLTGAGGTFCAGFDLKALAAGSGNRLSEAGDGPMGPTRMSLSKPVVAAIEGHAVAGGLE